MYLRIIFCMILTCLTFLYGEKTVCSAGEWEESVRNCPLKKDKESYRLYNEKTPDHVKRFYFLNHQNQTLDFVLQKKEVFLGLQRGEMDIWEAMEVFDQLVDESDPDLELPQRYHLFQTAEALRKDGHPRWLILTGLIHDLGKILACYGEPQWAVVGDTFPLGCAFSEAVVFSEFFSENPDCKEPEYQTLCGIYEPHCGFDQVHMSWGHDEYLYHVVKEYLPPEALYIIRYHSFYAAHREGGYAHLMDAKDRAFLPYLKLFSQYDLYSKSPEKLEIDELMPYYKELVAEFFPGKLRW